MKKFLINILLSTLLVSSITLSFDKLTFANNINMATDATTSSQSYESYLKYKPIIKRSIEESFNGIDKYIDISSEVEKVKDLNKGTIAIKFKTSVANKTQTLFSISDKNDSSSYFEIKIVNGYIRLETYENGKNVLSSTVQNKKVTDNTLHTLVISGGELGVLVYMDGIMLSEFPEQQNKFISLVNPVNSMNIGRKVTSEGATSYFDGEIKYVEAYDNQFSKEYSSKYSLNDYRDILNIVHGKESSNIVFAGDSITHGVSHTKGYRSYSEHLQERLRGEIIDGNLKSDSFVINTGVSSADTKNVISGYNSWIGTYNPKIVFLAFGMNDCVTMPLDVYKENLRILVKKIREQGAIPVIQTINTATSASTNRITTLPQFMNGAREVADELDVFVIDHYKYWVDKGSTVTNAWLNDAIHPNEKGHLEMAKLILRELQLDNQENYTQNLSYPLQGNGTSKPVVDIASKSYPEYLAVKDKTPIVSYKINREFYGNDFIDRTDEIDKVKPLSKGSIVAKFNLTSAANAQTILSLSDSKDPSKEVAIGINANGVISYNARTDKGSTVFTTTKGGYNDNKWHTLVVNSDGTTINIYVDGEKIHSVNSKVFF